MAGVFIELVLWGMFRFMAKSDVLFPQPQPNPMMSARKLAPPPAPRSVLQNNPPVDISVFPEPRLQTGDAADMDKFLYSEQKTLNPDQPFMDQSGAVHIPISQAMKLIEERGLPVRPNARRRSSVRRKLKLKPLALRTWDDQVDECREGLWLNQPADWRRRISLCQPGERFRNLQVGQAVQSVG